MEVAGRRHEVTAENLAHLQMPGFRRRVLPQATFAAVMQNVDQRAPGAHLTRLGTAAEPIQYDFAKGPVHQTGRPLDIAIANDGFFSIQGPDGPLYTRNGSFHLNEAGQLTTIDGLPLLGEGRPISVPPQTSSQAIQISDDGRLTVDNVEFGRLSMVRFSDPQQLVAEGATLFSAPSGAGVETSDVSVQQGYLEETNVSAVEEMVRMIANNRQYEAAQRTMKKIAEMTRQRIGL